MYNITDEKILEMCEELEARIVNAVRRFGHQPLDSDRNG
jgi:hypothetical protein